MSHNFELRELLREKMMSGEVTTEELTDIIRPYYTFDERKVMETHLKEKTRSLMAGYKDEYGNRSYFSDNKGNYINIDIIDDIGILNKIQSQLEIKYVGLKSSIEKVKYRKKQLINEWW